MIRNSSLISGVSSSRVLASILSIAVLGGISTESNAGSQGGAGVKMGEFEPVVPELNTNTISGLKISNSQQMLDGLVCLNCEFENVVLTYSGGGYKLVNPQFKGNVSIEFKGAARNAIELFQKLSPTTRKSPRYDPNANPKVPVTMTPGNNNLMSLGIDE